MRMILQQAILPLKGKVINIEKATNDRIYQNAEIQALITALGLGLREQEFQVNKLRYHRIIIMTGNSINQSHPTQTIN